MLVLDTDELGRDERAEAFQALVSANCSTSMALFEDQESFRSRMHVFDLGPAKVFNIDASGTTLRRTPRMARAAEHCEITLALPVRTTNRLMWDREERAYGPRDMILADLSGAYVYEWRGMGASYAFHVELDRLGLPMDTIRRAALDLHTSPLYPMVRDHIWKVTTEGEQLAGGPAATHLGLATIELMRALILSAGGDDRARADAVHTTTAARVEAYVQDHLREADLRPAQIASANGVSLRTLYALYTELGTSLEQSIIEQRLAGARRDLADPRRRGVTIAAVARSWGFSTPSFFSSRFRQAYGVTPKEWRAAATVDGEQGRA